MNKNLNYAADNRQRSMKLILPIVVAVLLLGGLLAFAVASGNTTSSGVSTPSKPVSVAGIQLPAVGGNQITLSDYVGQKPVLLYFSMGVG